ncbi:MAG: endonuclease Q family protein [Patescibacteria group bacterium]|nr:endonuclease Q family protein [Patescibacteria group bacterium]
MQQITDLHIHSKHSRACSPQLTLENIDKTCRTKGVDIIATGDFTYPDWFSGIKNDLEEISGKRDSRISPSGLYKLKSAQDDKVKFLLSTELSLIYKKGDKVRRIHIMAHAPNIKAVAELNKFLDKKYNIRSDGRPILGMRAEELVKLCLSIHPKFLIYPAHIWTPWFAVFGSKSGFDSMEECFGNWTKDIYAYETGLSSDPEMNWRLSALDGLTVLSNSDAHSLPNIGREANVFDLEEISYDEIYQAIKDKNSKKIKYTIEFYPEEGMYHYDGHRACGVCLTPEETKRHKGICPVCKKPLTVGVMYRIDELADRPIGFQLKGAPGFKKLVELDKIIAEALNIKSRNSKAVQIEYNNLIKQFGNELKILMDIDLAELKEATLPEIAEGVKRVREGKLIIKPGFDGQYGTVKIFQEDEKKNNQQSLF